MLETQELVINMGPQHPSTHGVLRLLLHTDGEIIVEAQPHVGYLHRGIEKIAEKVNYHQFMPYTDRIDYLASMNCNHAYACAVERLMGIEVPERAQFIRVIMSELNRIASHLVFFGSFGMDVGAFTPFLYGLRERERTLDLFEAACGQRLTYNYMKIGGVRWDLPPGWTDKCREFCDYFEPKIQEYHDLLTYNYIFMKRLGNIGVLTPEDALAYGVTGPNLRASGVAYDIRKEEPYDVYDRLEFDIPVGTGEAGAVGDCFDRYMVRIKEMQQSVRIIRQCLDMMPEGDVQARVPRVLKIPPKEIYFRAENPRGELGFYIVANGKPSPERLKIRGASFSNIHVMEKILPGLMVADAVAVIASLDVILPECDR